MDERNESSCSQVLSTLCCMQLTKACTAEISCNQFICSSVYQFVFIGLIAGPMHKYTFHEFYRVIRMVVTCHLMYKIKSTCNIILQYKAGIALTCPIYMYVHM